MEISINEILIVGTVSTLTLGPGVYESEGNWTFDYGVGKP